MHDGSVAVLMVATCQFPVSSDVEPNCRYVLHQRGIAKESGAQVVHFPEGALSGYAGTDFETFASLDWNQLQEATGLVVDQARQLGLWVVLGSAHRLSIGNRPHNSLYVISSEGEIIERYDKRFCSGGTDGRSGDLAPYSPGNHFSVWTIQRRPMRRFDLRDRSMDGIFHSGSLVSDPRSNPRTVP